MFFKPLNHFDCISYNMLFIWYSWLPWTFSSDGTTEDAIQYAGNDSKVSLEKGETCFSKM